ncbi:alpha/beta hydrolase family protein [Alloscardovia venturai]|uniref:Alpha/beta hydrolase family protein n=1 Tax=Alloscardovia venturai TaxID=1769421 RepID=A0ABW2YAQ8_9BIFI
MALRRSIVSLTSWFRFYFADRSDGSWPFMKRFLSSIIIFGLLMGIFIGVSHLTNYRWNNDTTDLTVHSTTADTSISFKNTTGVELPRRNTYRVREIRDSIFIKQPSTGKIQKDDIILRVPMDANGQVIHTIPGMVRGMPAAVFVHGAGVGNSNDSFNDVGADLASAGFATLVMDKPRWDTNDFTRDYPASAKAYEKAVEYLRQLPYVDADKVGLFTTSEGTWISPYIVRDDKHIAFEIMMSPMVFSPRHSLGFSVSQLFAILGANNGYQNIVQRVFSLDTASFGFGNIDFESQIVQGYNVPILVAYGAKDVLTAQVSGAQRILELAHKAGNWDVTIRDYPIGNHVLRVGDQTQARTLYVDHYEYDFVDWAVGVARGLEQSTSKIAGSDVQQAILVPEDLRAHRTMTFYAVVIHSLMIIFLALSVLIGVYSLGKKLLFTVTRRKRHVFGFVGRYQSVLIRISLVTIAAMLLFFAAIAQLVYRVINLIWGAAPESPGMIYWSWYAVQTVCVIVIFTWAVVGTTLIESAYQRWIFPRIMHEGYKASIEHIAQNWTQKATHVPTCARLVRHAHRTQTTDTDSQILDESACKPILASTKLGIIFFGVTTIAMFFVLLMFSFWGVFIY